MRSARKKMGVLDEGGFKEETLYKGSDSSLCEICDQGVNGV